MTYCNEKRMPCEWAQIGGGCSVSVCQKVPLTVVGWPMPTEQPEFVKPPMTNADRIRAMSDEDMQFFLEDIYANGWTDAVEDSSNNRVDWETWLQQPAEEADHD